MAAFVSKNGIIRRFLKILIYLLFFLFKMCVVQVYMQTNTGELSSRRASARIYVISAKWCHMSASEKHFCQLWTSSSLEIL